MIYALTSTKIIPIRYRAKGRDWYINRQVPFYIGVLNPFGDYIVMETQKVKESILHTDQEINQVETILQKEGIKYTKINKNEIKQILSGRITKSESSLDRTNNYFNPNYFGRQLLDCDVCDNTGWLDTDIVCPKCEP